MPAREKPKKAGRPKLPKGEALGKVIPFRFQEEERRLYKGMADAEGVTLSEWIRNALKNAVSK